MKKLDPKIELEKKKARIRAIGQMERGAVWCRVIAGLLDGLIILSITATMNLLLLGDRSQLGHLSFKQFLVVYLMKLAFVVLYNGLFISMKGASPGKIIMHLQIVDLSTGQFPDFVRANLREFSKIISAVCLLYGFVMMAIRPDRRALHDLMLDTVVIKVS